MHPLQRVRGVANTDMLYVPYTADKHAYVGESGVLCITVALCVDLADLKQALSLRYQVHTRDCKLDICLPGIVICFYDTDGAGRI